MDRVAAGLATLGGCVVQSGMDDHACPRGHGWRHEARADHSQLPAPPVEATAARLLAAGDLAAAEQAYRAALSMCGEGGEQSRVLRHALAIILAASGRQDQAGTLYGPVHAARDAERLDRLDRIRRRLRRTG